MRLALFDLAATLPGVQALGTIRDAMGRSGIGIGYSDGTVTREIVFDAGSARVLGLRNVGDHPSSTEAPSQGAIALGVVPGTSVTFVDSELVRSVDRTTGT
jgi:hypothetical protein